MSLRKYNIKVTGVLLVLISLSCSEIGERPELLDAREKSILDSEDFCLILNWYRDGICDLVCAQPDPDCANATGASATEATPSEQPPSTEQPSPAVDQPPSTEQTSSEFDEYGCPTNWDYQDGSCEEDCAHRDPDCQSEATPGSESTTDDEDPCPAEWYYDDMCDMDCLYPDPVCADQTEEGTSSANESNETDLCVIYDLYGDGSCDDFCDYEDPDCD